MQSEGALDALIRALRCLPSVGPKSAQRMCFYLLERDPEGARRLASALNLALDTIRECDRCRTLTESSVCGVCESLSRDSSLLCVVESPSEVSAIEQSTGFKGLYFVLHGRLSPLDGIGPEELKLNLLEARLGAGEVKEVILATNTTVEGEATAFYIHEMAHRFGIKTSRLAYGMPLGGELEYVDGATLSHAFNGRRMFWSSNS